MTTVNTLPFQYLTRADVLERLSGMMRTQVFEQRDRDLEDYLGRRGAEVDTRLAAITAQITATAWTALGLGNGWSTTGTASQIPRYRKIGDLVYVEGACRQTGAYVQGTVATLPLGFRPPLPNRYQLGAHKAGVGGNNLMRVSIDTAGVIATSDYSAAAGTPRDDPLLYLDMIPPFSTI